MRITFLTHTPGRGGSTALLSQLLEFFRSRGHAVSVVVGDDAANPLVQDYKIVPVPSASSWRARMQSYKETVEKTKPDLVYSISGKDELDVHRFLKCPRVRHVFSLEEHEYVNIPFWLRQTAGFSEALTANTPDVLQRICTSPNQVEVVAPYRIASAYFQLDSPQANAGERGVLDVCFIGRLERFQKRVHWLPQIVLECKKNGANFRWHIYGDGPEGDALRTELGKNRCLQDVQFHGWLDSATLTRELPRHDLFFLCSRWEGLPVAMVEAMLCGLGCVVPAIPAGITYVLEKGGGWTYKATSPKEAVKALLEVSKKPQAVAEAKIQAHRIARSLFDESVVSRQLQKLEGKLMSLRFNNHVLRLDQAHELRSVPVSMFVKRKFLRIYKILRKLK